MHVKVAPGDPASAPAHLVGRLRMFVADGVLQPGEPTPIGEVAEMLGGVSASTALGVLMEVGRDGFLERVDDETIRVRPVADGVQDNILQIRQLLEPAALRGAAEHARLVDLITLRSLVEAVDAAIEACDYQAFRHADDALVATLLWLHPNVELARLCVELRLRTAYDGLRVPVEYDVLGSAFRQHGRLVDLVGAGDLDAVEQLARDAVAALHYVGSPRMDTPHLVGAPVVLDTEADVEFLEDGDG